MPSSFTRTLISQFSQSTTGLSNHRRRMTPRPHHPEFPILKRAPSTPIRIDRALRTSNARCHGAADENPPRVSGTPCSDEGAGELLPVDVEAIPEAFPAEHGTEDLIEPGKGQESSSASTRSTMGPTLRRTGRRISCVKQGGRHPSNLQFVMQFS